MVWYMPTRVFSESGCVKNHARELGALGRKAMIVTGRSSAKKCGALEDVQAALESQNVKYVLFDRVEENPSIETVMAARELAITQKVDFFIGIGGGSPMDAAKAIALMAANPRENEGVLYTAKLLAHLPVVCVPTTCGTGSEVTPYAILTRHALRTKKSISHKIYPALALLDAKYLESMSRKGIVSTAVDALAHLLESWLNANTNDLNRLSTREGLRLWGQFKDRLAGDCLVQEDYALMLHASMAAGISITHTGTSVPHAMSYPVTYELGVPHGTAVGMFLGGFAEAYPDKEAVQRAMDILGFENSTQFHTYLTDLLGTVEVSESVLKTGAKLLLSDPAKLKNYPFPITEEEILKMIN